MALVDRDLLSLMRGPRRMPARWAAVLESLRNGGVPWTKTAAWSTACQQALTRGGALALGQPVLFAQTLPACVLPGTLRYGIYTDRVGREGAATGGPFASRFSAAWLQREEAFLCGAHRIYVMGPTTKTVLMRQYGIPEGRVVVVGAGPNAPLGPAVARSSCRRLLFVGTNWALKGGPELLRAFAGVRRDHPQLELLLVGGEPSGPLPPRVRAVGRVPHTHMDALYDQADLLVIPTHQEAFGIALVEGLMKGLPCIASTVGNQPWIVGDAGICVAPGDVAALEEALRRVIRAYAIYHERALVRGRLLREKLRWGSVAGVIVRDLVCGDIASTQDLQLSTVCYVQLDSVQL
ncbi:MAG: glycosyltransferase family 4 protein [Armatimonadota bacterium]|nr:glycosyltransferase family 4 protein [Armatimonadota bacterium]